MKHLLIILLLLCSASVFAQDVIVKKDGSTIVCRVIELTSTEIVYKKWSDLNGSNYVMNRTDASAINYGNGKKVNLSEATNLYTPGNQNDGVQQYNDRALYLIDRSMHVTPMGTKVLRITGCLVGALAVGVSVYAIVDNGSDSSLVIISSLVGGAVLTTGCFVAANLYKKHYNNKHLASTLYQYDFQFNNGSSLSAGIDLISDRTIGSNSLGLGLRYNF